MVVSQALLQLFSPFDQLNEQQLDYITDFVQLQRIKKGTFIIKRGKSLDAIRYIVSGTVDLVDSQFANESIDGDSDRRAFPLTLESPSPISAQVKTDAEVLVVQHEAYGLMQDWRNGRFEKRAMAQSESNMMHDDDNTHDWMMALLDSSLFAQVPPTQIQQLFSRFEPIEVEADELVIKENDDGENFYVIESGRARVHNRTRGDITVLHPGHFFGEEALVGDTIRNASVTMETDGVLMQLNKDDFKALLQAPLIRYIDSNQLNKELLAGQKMQLVDVRLPAEHREVHVKESTNIPLSALRRKLQDLDNSKTYVVTDDAGKRSEVAAHLMCQAGFTTYILAESVKHYALG